MWKAYRRLQSGQIDQEAVVVAFVVVVPGVWSLVSLQILICVAMVVSRADPVQAGLPLSDYFFGLSYRPLDLHAGLHWRLQLPLRPPLAAVRQPSLCCVPEWLGNSSSRCFLQGRVILKTVLQQRWFLAFHRRFQSRDIASLRVLSELAVMNKMMDIESLSLQYLIYVKLPCAF